MYRHPAWALRAHSTPDPDPDVPPEVPPAQPPDDIPLPGHAPVEEPRPPTPPIKLGTRPIDCRP